MLKILTIQALRKTPSLAKTLKTLLLSLAVSDLSVGFLVQPLYTVGCNSCDEHITKHWKHCLCYSIQSVFYSEKNIGLSFAFWCYFINCWQILGNPSSSHIPGASDSQACCCQLCSTLDSSFMPPIIVVVCVISTGLLYCKVDAAVRHHTGTSSTEWRYGKRCKGQKIYTCYILRVCGVFRLLFPQCQCLVLFLPRPLVKLPCYLIYGILHWLLCISIHPSILDLLLEDETHLTNCYGSYTSKYPCDWLVRNKKELIQNIFLWWKKPFHQYSWKNDTY